MPPSLLCKPWRYRVCVSLCTTIRLYPPQRLAETGTETSAPLRWARTVDVSPALGPLVPAAARGGCPALPCPCPHPWALLLYPPPPAALCPRLPFCVFPSILGSSCCPLLSFQMLPSHSGLEVITFTVGPHDWEAISSEPAQFQTHGGARVPAPVPPPGHRGRVVQDGPSQPFREGSHLLTGFCP